MKSMLPITSAQMTKLWAGARELGVDADDLHNLVHEMTAKDSLRQLTKDEAARVIDALVDRGASSGRPRRLPPDVPRLMTPFQATQIKNLVIELGWQDARALVEGVAKRALGGRVKVLTTADAAKAIEAFKAILRRRRGDAAPSELQG